MFNKDVNGIIKNFMYDTSLDLKDKKNVKVISTPYFKVILSSALSDNSNVGQYSIIAGDFNKVSKLNNEYDVDEINKCIQKCLRIISNILPKDSLIIRYGGDEFVILLPGVNKKEDLDGYINEINIQIAQRSDLHGLNITLASAQSSSYKSIYQMYNHADKKINKEKMKKRSTKIDYKESLNKSLEEFFSAMRLSNNHEFSYNQKVNIAHIACETASKMIMLYPEKERETIASKDIKYRSSSIFNQFEALHIHNYVTGISSYKSQYEISEKKIDEDLKNLAKGLVFNGQSKTYTNKYFHDFLLTELPSDKKYNITLLSLSGLKLSNLIKGHILTDKDMDDGYNRINRILQEDLFNREKPFNVNGDTCFAILLGGGNLLFISPEKIQLPIQDIVKSTNSSSDLLRYIEYSSKKPMTSNEFINFIEKAKVGLEEKEDEFKEQLIDDDNYNSPISKALRKCIQNEVEIYCRQNPNDYKKPYKLKQFLFSLVQSISTALSSKDKSIIEENR